MIFRFGERAGVDEEEEDAVEKKEGLSVLVTI